METSIIIFFYLIVLLYSVIIHEISHGVVALWLGDRTAKMAGRLTLEPISHIDPIGSIILPLTMIMTTGFAFGWAKPVPYNPFNLRYRTWGPVMVAFVGPITNFLLAGIAATVGNFVNIARETKFEIIQAIQRVSWEDLTALVAGDLSAIFFAVLMMMIFWNVLLGVFNLIPLPPLDGSKLLFAFVPIKPETQMFLERWGFVIILFLLFMPGFSHVFHGILQFIWGIFYTIAL